VPKRLQRGPAAVERAASRLFSRRSIILSA